PTLDVPLPENIPRKYSKCDFCH
ncbi:integrase, partial [Shigella flexneri]|nr:integrase [Shigella flexneri]